jgi:NAD(P)-dependent dehydrogenase (short-subunit alcohol dehydrogenase family)
MKTLGIDLTGKVALITGASRGIGRACAETLAAHGARLAVHYRQDREAAQKVAAALKGNDHVILQADLTDADAASQLVSAAVTRCGGLDILVNNAGIYEPHPLGEATYLSWQKAWRRHLDLNLVAVANVTFCAAQHMMCTGGRIVNISSRGAFRGEPECLAYGASKAGLNALSQSLAQALAPHGIFVTVVAPGFVQTDMTERMLAGPAGEAIRQQSPLGRVALPQEVADTVLFLASGHADFLTGAIVDINGASYLRS